MSQNSLPLMLLLLVVVVSTSRCGGPSDEAVCADPVAFEKRLRQEIREELLAEMRGEISSSRDPRLLPASVQVLGDGEQRAIATAAAERDKPAPLPTKPEIEHIRAPATHRPDKLTAADRKALGDDPAAQPLRVPVVEWPTDDDGEKPAPTARAIRARHLDPAPLKDQIDTAQLPTAPSGDRTKAADPRRGEGAVPPLDDATRQAEQDDPARTVGAPDDGVGKTLRPGVTVMPAREGLRIIDLAIAQKMQGRNPFNIADNYPNPPAVLACFGAYQNRLQEAQITHVWRKDGKVVSRVELRVGVGAKWRTWSRQRVRGGDAEYSCEVLSPTGKRMGIARATVGGGRDAAQPKVRQ